MRCQCGHGRARHERGLHGYVLDENGATVAATALAAEYTPAFATVLARAHRRNHESRRFLRFNTLDTMVDDDIDDYRMCKKHLRSGHSDQNPSKISCG